MQNKFLFKEGIDWILFDDLIEKIKFIEKNEINYLAPLLSIKEFKVYIFQEVLHSILGEYLNTPLKLSQNSSKQIVGLNPFLTSNSKFDTPIKISDLPEIILEGYGFLHASLGNFGFEEAQLDFEIEYLKKDEYKGRSKILKLTEFCNLEFNDYVISMLLHGSCADLQMTEFSDIDTFVIIKAETINSLELIKNFKKIWQKSLRYIYQFDSLQHHNHMFATEIDLNFYPYHWLPPQVIESSKVIAGNNKFHIKVFKNEQLIFRSFLQLSQRFRNENIKAKVYNEYSFKNDLSVILLFPTLYLQSCGYNITKENSFSHPEILKIDLNSIFPKLSEIRKYWKTSTISKTILSTHYNYFIRLYYLRYCIKKINPTIITNKSQLKIEFIDSLNSLINSMSNKITNEIHEE